MKNINFIKSISPSQASSIRIWLLSSSVFGFSLILCLSIAIWQEYFSLRILKRTQEQLHLSMTSFDSIMKHKQELKKQEQTIKEQLNLIAATNKQTQRHAQLIAHIKKTLKNSAMLESLNLESTDIQLCIDCAQTQQASEIISLLTQLPDISGLHMSSLQPKQQGATTGLRLNLRGTIKPS